MFLNVTLPTDARSLAPRLLASDLHHAARSAAGAWARRPDDDSIAAVRITKHLVETDKRQKTPSQQSPRDADLA
jgi:1,2-phenylacetyl-CoA epoxidase PaaB subunit